MARAWIVALLCIVLVGSASSEALGPLDARPDAQSTTGPITVAVGIFIEQVVSVDQVSENFVVVANIRLRWEDSQLAFDAAAYGRDYKVLTPSEFRELASSVPTIIPAFVIQNQQGRRWEQQDVVTINEDGLINYYERATVTLQAPHFDFRKFPFDTQPFYLEVTSLHPTDTVDLVAMPDYSGLGDLLGEEAWILENPSLNASTVTGLSGLKSAQIALGFTGRRHIQYYTLRIFLPMAVLIVVSWATFFLDEYRRRIEITGANLLAFILFNFAVSNKLPELGYLTFLDFILQWMFIVTGGIIVLNVGLTRLVKSGREELAHKIDTYVIKWVYPIGYGAVIALAVLQFFIWAAMT